MTRETSRDFHPQALKLFDRYVHGQLSRRGFLQQAGRYAAAGVGAEALLLSLSPNFAEAQQVAPDDKRLIASYVEYPSLLMEGHDNRIDPDRWNPLIMSFQKFYGLAPGQVHPSKLGKIEEATYRSPDVDRARTVTR